MTTTSRAMLAALLVDVATHGDPLAVAARMRTLGGPGTEYDGVAERLEAIVAERVARLRKAVHGRRAVAASASAEAAVREAHSLQMERIRELAREQEEWFEQKRRLWGEV